MDRSLTFRNAVGETMSRCDDADIVPIASESALVRKIERSMIEVKVISRDRVQKLIAVADFELRSLGAFCNELDLRNQWSNL